MGLSSEKSGISFYIQSTKVKSIVDEADLIVKIIRKPASNIFLCLIYY